MEKVKINPKEVNVLPAQKTKNGMVQVVIRPANKLSKETIEKLRGIKIWV